MYKKIVFIFLITTILGFTDLQSSIDSLKSEIEKDPDNHILYYKLGGGYIFLKDYANALAAYIQAFKCKPDFILACYRIGFTYFLMDSLEKAYENMQNIKDVIPKEYKGSVFVYLGMICTRTYRYREAIEHYQCALNHYPSDPDYAMTIALLCNKIGDSLQARKWFNKTIKYVSEVKSWSKITKLWHSAVYHYYFGSFDMAISLNEQVINADTTDGIARYNMGNYRIAAGDTNGLNDIRAAISKDSTGFVKAIYATISCLLADSFADAEMQLTQNIPGLKKSGLAFGLHAWTLEKLGRDDEAKKYWAEAWGRLPLGVDVESMRAYINKFLETIKRNQ